MNKTYCIVYKTGGKDNFKWNRSLGFTDIDMATETYKEIIKKGYTAYLMDYGMSLNIGLPESYE